MELLFFLSEWSVRTTFPTPVSGRANLTAPFDNNKKRANSFINPLWSEWGDLNSRPLDPQSSALTVLRHTPKTSCKDKY